jgi:hypothetical protein
MSKEMICSGYSATPNQKILHSDSPATVRLHKLGSVEASYLTPNEARALAEMLFNAALEAEKT